MLATRRGFLGALGALALARHLPLPVRASEGLVGPLKGIVDDGTIVGGCSITRYPMIVDVRERVTGIDYLERVVTYTRVEPASEWVQTASRLWVRKASRQEGVPL